MSLPRKNATRKTSSKTKSNNSWKSTMNSTGPRDDLSDVPDSTDWLGTPLSSLADVDSLLRCQVCKDFFTTPMITSCSHTFCSLCIRRCLSNDSKCPACRSIDQEIKLKSNGVIEDLVEAFKRARPATLEFARKPTIEVTVTSPKRKREVLDLDGEETQTNKRTRSSTRLATRPAGPMTNSQETVVIDDGKADEDFIPDDGLSACPVCQRRMTAKEVEVHIGKCLAENDNSTPPSSLSKPAFTSSNPVKRPERLPHVNFDLIKDQQLRKKMADLGLSSAGSRVIVIKRLREYMTIWNANCDAKHPRSPAQLKKDLDTWERTLGSRAPQPSSMAAQIKDKDFDGAAWGTRHKDSFDDLIAQARAKVKLKTLATVEGNEVASSSQSRPLSEVTLEGDDIQDVVPLNGSQVAGAVQEGPPTNVLAECDVPSPLIPEAITASQEHGTTVNMDINIPGPLQP